MEQQMEKEMVSRTLNMTGSNLCSSIRSFGLRGICFGCRVS